MIAIISPTRIEVDGVDAGLPLDYFLANVSQRPAVQAAFITWHASHVLAQQARDADLAAAKAALADEKAALIAAHNDEVAALEADIATLGTKPEAAEIRKAQAVTALQDEIAAKTAELAKLMPADLEPIDVRLP